MLSAGHVDSALYKASLFICDYMWVRTSLQDQAIPDHRPLLKTSRPAAAVYPGSEAYPA